MTPADAAVQDYLWRVALERLSSLGRTFCAMASDEEVPMATKKDETVPQPGPDVPVPQNDPAVGTPIDSSPTQGPPDQHLGT